jgi:hypothetical protein
MPTAKERMDSHERRLSEHDKQIKVIRDLVKEGMRLVVATRKDIQALATAQRKTEANLQRLIETLGHPPKNGKH